MSMSYKNPIFAGPFFDYIVSGDVLVGSTIFKWGSSAVLFQKQDKLFRLTSDAAGHNFLAELSGREIDSVVKVVKDFGPVAPMDENTADGDYYWLAEVEWLEDLEEQGVVGRRVAEFCEYLSDDGFISESAFPALVAKVENFPVEKFDKQFASLAKTLLHAEDFVIEGYTEIDVSPSNIMLRPSTGDLVWSDPLYGTSHFLSLDQEREMDRVRDYVESRFSV